MKVAMVKHTPNGKVFWFGVPDRLVNSIHPNSRVACDTARGRKYGTVVGSILDEKDVKDIMVASGATFPLQPIVAVAKGIPMADIKIPDYMARTKPCDDKMVKRFLELYHTGNFKTNVVVRKDGILIDGYSAYLVAQMMGFDFLTGIKEDE